MAIVTKLKNKSVSQELEMDPGLIAALVDIIAPSRLSLPGMTVAGAVGPKPFNEQEFKSIIPVLVRWIKNKKIQDEMIDEVKGLNSGHALWRAKQNWPEATVKAIKNLIGYSDEGKNFIPIKK
jgi:hypothetical protein